ncbi:hypothetical protein DQ384_36035 [Sphaerisporangium album]|uniref:Uncharacterized protein n=1 Tax=Sphaerisporangium album TaxID=509200 RepID=A0A367EWX8_9ACTN|nr:hypothetical protein DQ384_36035 [Sphaerisporangium album]
MTRLGVRAEDCFRTTLGEGDVQSGRPSSRRECRDAEQTLPGRRGLPFHSPPNAAMVADGPASDTSWHATVDRFWGDVRSGGRSGRQVSGHRSHASASVRSFTRRRERRAAVSGQERTSVATRAWAFGRRHGRS